MGLASRLSRGEKNIFPYLDVSKVKLSFKKFLEMVMKFLGYLYGKQLKSTSTNLIACSRIIKFPRSLKMISDGSYVKYCVKSEARWQPWAGLKCSAA